jgi:hypothetical protein
MNGNSHTGRRLTLTLAGLIAVASMTIVLAVSGGTHEGHAAAEHSHGTAMSVQTDRQLRFHDAMRKLWEDHITWTRLAIVSFAGNLPDLPATEKRLLRNQVDIGNAIKPFYGARTGRRLTELLKEHINGAVDLLQAAKAGDAGTLAEAKAAWYANGRQIADFLSAANRRNWPRAEMRAMMRTHLDQTLKEAADRLQGDFGADIRDYEAVHRHILMMADTLSDGIIRQFPRRFR